VTDHESPEVRILKARIAHARSLGCNRLVETSADLHGTPCPFVPAAVAALESLGFFRVVNHRLGPHTYVLCLRDDA
jgi:hypothetical protein